MGVMVVMLATTTSFVVTVMMMGRRGAVGRDLGADALKDHMLAAIQVIHVKRVAAPGDTGNDRRRRCIDRRSTKASAVRTSCAARLAAATTLHDGGVFKAVSQKMAQRGGRGGFRRRCFFRASLRAKATITWNDWHAGGDGLSSISNDRVGSSPLDENHIARKLVDEGGCQPRRQRRRLRDRARWRLEGHISCRSRHLASSYLSGRRKAFPSRESRPARGSLLNESRLLTTCRSMWMEAGHIALALNEAEKGDVEKRRDVLDGTRMP